MKQIFTSSGEETFKEVKAFLYTYLNIGSQKECSWSSENSYIDINTGRYGRHIEDIDEPFQKVGLEAIKELFREKTPPSFDTGQWISTVPIMEKGADKILSTGSGYAPGLTLKIKRVDSYSSNGYHQVLFFTNEGKYSSVGGSGIFSDVCRPATQEEINEALGRKEEVFEQPSFSFKEGDLVVVTKYKGKSTWEGHWFDSGEIVKLGGQYWDKSPILSQEKINSFKAIAAISKDSPKGNGMVKQEDFHFRHATKEEKEYYKEVGLGANINDLLKRQDEREERQDEVCDYCHRNILPEKGGGPHSLCEGSYCEEAHTSFEEEMESKPPILKGKYAESITIDDLTREKFEEAWKRIYSEDDFTKAHRFLPLSSTSDAADAMAFAVKEHINPFARLEKAVEELKEEKEEPQIVIKAKRKKVRKFNNPEI